MDTTTKSFNTGRKYSAEGQIIRYRYTDDGCTLLADITRGIDYEFPCVMDQETLLLAYAKNLGRPTQRSWDFLKREQSKGD